MNQEYFNKFSELYSKNLPLIQVTLVKAVGLTPQHQGAKAIVGSDGLLYGTVGGGKVEAKAILFAKEMIFQNTPYSFQEWNLQKDVGMTCGGVCSLYFENLRPNKLTINVFGAGHVSQELIPLLSKLDFLVRCFDDRKDWLEKFPQPTNAQLLHVENLAAEVKICSASDFFVLINKGHQTDFPILREILSSFSPPYIGVIGSNAKRLTLVRELIQSGIEESKTECFHCPIGLPIGNSNPVEIAISITSQILKIRDDLNLNKNLTFSS